MILFRQKAMYKLHLKKFMREKGLTREQLKNDKNIEVPLLRIQTGFCKSEVLMLENINKEI